jgi:hypothetical protein
MVSDKEIEHVVTAAALAHFTSEGTLQDYLNRVFNRLAAVDATENPATDAEAAVSGDIDAILKRLDDGIPRLFEDMKNIQASLRRPLAF